VLSMLIESSGISAIRRDREMWRLVFRSEKCRDFCGYYFRVLIERNSVTFHGRLEVSDGSP